MRENRETKHILQRTRTSLRNHIKEISKIKTNKLKRVVTSNSVAHRRATHGEKKNDDDGELGTSDDEGSTTTTKIEMRRWSNDPVTNVSALEDASSADTNGTDTSGTGSGVI